MQNKTALVVDDSRVARMTLGKLLKAQDFVVVEQGSGEDALSWLQSDAENPDIIFMDVMMGGMDGLTACRQIKTIDNLADIPVVICTGNDSEADLEKAMATGAASVLSKPPAAEALQSLLDAVSTSQAAKPAQQQTEAEPASIDTDALLVQLREQLLPELQQQIQTSADEINRNLKQLTEETTSKYGLSLVPEISQKVAESAQQQLNDLKQGLTSQAESVVASVADQAMEQAMQRYGLTEKVMVTLRSEGTNWLDKQQSTVQDNLLKHAQQDLQPMVSQYLDEHLNERVLPLVKSQLTEVQQELEDKQQGNIASLRSQLNLQRTISIVSGLIAIAAVVIALV
jgi:CheY-like chemotaxis protein